MNCGSAISSTCNVNFIQTWLGHGIACQNRHASQSSRQRFQ